MRKLLAIMVIGLALLAACAQPPEDVPRAEIKDDVKDEMPADDMSESEEMADETMDGIADMNESKEMTNESMEKMDEVVEVEMPEGAEKVPVVVESSEFAFTGYGPGKEHKGTFDDWSGNLWVNDGEVVGADGVVQVSSVNTGIDRLDAHLASEDFFNAEMYPEITFAGTIEDGVMTGPFSFNGVTHVVSYPVNVSESSIAGDFLLDTTPFNFKYTAINKDVRIEFDASI